MSQQEVIDCLREHEILDASQIAVLCSANVLTIRQSIRRLKKFKMVERIYNSEDYRRSYWRLTACGRR